MTLRIGARTLCKLLLLLSISLLPGCTAEQIPSDLANMPDCAADCLVIAIANSPCMATNRTCVCTNNGLQTEITACVTEICTVQESLVTKNLTMTHCGAPVHDGSGAYVIQCITLTAIAGLCAIQRLALKHYLRLRLGLDDWFILITALLSIPASGIKILGLVPNGLGRDIWTLTPSSITNFGLFFFIIAILYFAQVTSLKLAILFFYLRIFLTDPVRRLLWGTVLINCVFGIVFTIIALFQCQPISFFWEQWDKAHTGHCFNTDALTASNAAISIALDVWMLAIPMLQISTLNLDWKKKIGVGLMFCVGTFVTVVSILRLQSVVKFRSETGNPTQDFLEISKWSTIEINIGIVCACMPSIRLLFSRLFPSLFGTSRRHYGNYGTNQTPQERRRRISIRTNILSNVDMAHQRIYSKETTRQGTSVTELTDNDEAWLVHMRDLGQKSSASDLAV